MQIGKKSPLRIKAEQIACPQCGAKPGESCKYPVSSLGANAGAFHLERYEAAKVSLDG